jgi:hypothetical protein
MSRLHKAAAAVSHILVVSIGLHVYHFATSDRMLDAFADVGLDKITSITLATFKMGAE